MLIAFQFTLETQRTRALEDGMVRVIASVIDHS